MPLEPTYGDPAQERPRRAKGPSGQHVGRPVDAEIDAAQADDQREEHADAEDVGFDAPAFLGVREQAGRASGTLGPRPPNVRREARRYRRTHRGRRRQAALWQIRF